MPIVALTPFARRRFRPKLWPTLAAVVVVVTTIALGNWQSRRADARGAIQTQMADASTAPVLALASAAGIAPAERYRPVTAAGEYVAARQILLDNRTYRGSAGYYVLTPLRFDDGTHVLVNRGWIAATTQHTPPPVAPPAGRVAVNGRLNQPPSSFLELQHTAPVGAVWQNLDLAEYIRVTGQTVAPLVIEATGAANDGLVRDWPAPASGREKNISYMWQWYGFAALTAVLWLLLNWQPRSRP